MTLRQLQFQLILYLFRREMDNYMSSWWNGVLKAWAKLIGI